MSQSLWVHRCVSPVVSRRPWFCGILLPLWLLCSFCLLFCRVLWALRGRIQWWHHFRVKCSKVSHSLYVFWLGISVFTYIPCRSVSNDGWARQTYASLVCVANGFSQNVCGSWCLRQRKCGRREKICVIFKNSTVTWIRLNVSWFSLYMYFNEYDILGESIVSNNKLSWRDEELLYVCMYVLLDLYDAFTSALEWQQPYWYSGHVLITISLDEKRVRNLFSPKSNPVFRLDRTTELNLSAKNFCYLLRFPGSRQEASSWI